MRFGVPLHQLGGPLKASGRHVHIDRDYHQIFVISP